MNLISYSLFESKQINNHRFWDKFYSKDRYWYNIPAIICINKLIYPNFDIKIHICPETKNHRLYNLLELLVDNFGVILEEINYPYQNTEPTIWRYKPLIDDEGVDILLCRDIDSLPTSDEIRSTKYFINNDKFLANTIRSHTNHTAPNCIILAGLCAFRPSKINFDISYEDFYNKISTPTWGLDQNALISMFAINKDWMYEYFLDSPLSTADHKVGRPLMECTYNREDFYRQNVKLDIDENILDLLDSYTTWAGEPIDVRGNKLELLLSNFPKMDNIINDNEELKKFYY